MCGVLAGALAKAGHDVTIAAPFGSIPPEDVALIETVHLPEEQDRDYLVDERVSPDGFDIIHDFSHRSVFKENPRAIHEYWDPILVDYDFKAHRNALCVSEWQKERFERMYKRKGLVMNPWLDTDIYRPALNPRRERYLFLGKLSLSKGAHRIINWAIQNKQPLDVVGGLIPSDDHKYLDMIRPYCTGDIALHYNVTEEEKLDFLQNAKAVMYSPVQPESHCLVGMEAWAVDTPFLVHDLGIEVSGPLHEIFAPVPNLREEAVRRWSLPVAVKAWTELYEKVTSGFSW